MLRPHVDLVDTESSANAGLSNTRSNKPHNF